MDLEVLEKKIRVTNSIGASSFFVWELNFTLKADVFLPQMQRIISQKGISTPFWVWNEFCSSNNSLPLCGTEFFLDYGCMLTLCIDSTINGH
jgi:hypothetical protein